MKSRSSLKQQFSRIFSGGILVAVLFPASNAFALTGTCAMLVTMPVPYGASLSATHSYNILAAINFTYSTISFNEVSAIYAITGTTFNRANTGSTIPFTTATGPIAGSQTITFNPGGGVISANIYPVNGNNTVLVQGANDLFSGVCQF